MTLKEGSERIPRFSNVRGTYMQGLHNRVMNVRFNASRSRSAMLSVSTVQIKCAFEISVTMYAS